MPPKGHGEGAFEAVDAFVRGEGGVGRSRPLDELDGVGWIAHPHETMRRASHALVHDGAVWLVDPVDAVDLDAHLAELGRVAGVVVLFNHHRRDAAAVARRHDVAVHLPAGMSALDAHEIDAPVERVAGELGDTGYVLEEVLVDRLWQEWALFDGETLVVPESVGTAPYFLTPGERLGVSLLRRHRPPRTTLVGLAPDRVLCGHGPGVFDGAADELEGALERARRTAPSAYLRHGATLVRNLTSAIRR